jgi:hypothetical protein
MSDSDTFLDSILDGVTIAPATTPSQSSPPSKLKGLQQPDPTTVETNGQARPGAPTDPASDLTGLDALLEGLGSLEESNGTPTSENASAVAPEAKHVEVAESPIAGPEPQNGYIAPSVDLPVAAPHEILGLPGQSEVSASLMDLAHEVNDIAATETDAPDAQPAKWEDTHSFAAIAREIAATVDTRPSPSKSDTAAKQESEAERSSVYIRSRGRRRRRRVNRVTLTQVVGLILLLVVGLVGEFEYVAKGQSSSPTSLQTLPPVPAVKLPTVAATRAPGKLFRYATSGSAKSALFRVSSPFAISWSVRCTQATKASSVNVVFQFASGTKITGFDVPVKAATTRNGATATARSGTYEVVAHAPGTCTWSAEGIARG